MASEQADTKDDPPDAITRPTSSEALDVAVTETKPMVAGGRNEQLTVVALGASAGGLEALTQFFDHVPTDSGMAFVVVTHQHPGHASLLPELVAKHTQMSVSEARDGDRLEPNQVFVAPARGHLEVFHGQIQVLDSPNRESFHLPIDSFLRSLAVDQRERAICVVLSGTGTDGTLGLRAIKGESGMVMVQEPESAKYSGMPQSAIDTGLADYVLPVTEMPSKLVTYVGGSYLGVPESTSKDQLANALPKIYQQLRTRTGHDFSSYKTSTIRRRIERRMNVQQIDLPDVYVAFLREHPHEIDQLFKELLITVTNFFRDPEAFETLAQAIRTLVESKSENDAIRAWVPGCATGEEAYSIAIVIREFLTTLERNLPVQVFATDLDGDAIEAARLGRYPEGIAGDVDAQRLRKFFTREDHGYRIKKEIREMVVFAPQDVIKDPPFTKLDLLSCRNMLIYLNSDLQKRLLPVFHFALNPGGLLFLGPSETVGEAQDLFAVESKKWKLYRRRETATVKHPEFPLTSINRDVQTKAPAARPKIPAARTAADLLQEHLMRAYVPPTVIVDARGDIIHVQGKTGLYLELPSGHMSNNLIEMAREGLQLDLAAALRHANIDDRPVVHRNITVKSNGEFTCVDIHVKRISDPEPIRGMFMVTFEPAQIDMQQSRPEGAGETEGAEQGGGRAERLQHELQYLRETLQTTVEEYETTNEELKSTNEELQSTNEELQSSNEELETSKEEMQSLNEELQTVNAELSSKVDELSQANDDMQNLLNSTGLATLFVDNELHVKRFTQSATKIFRIRDVDIGRHLSEIVTDLACRSLVDAARRVLESLVFEETEVLTHDGSFCYRMRIMPYRTFENVIDGVVLTFVDINEIREARDFAESIVTTISEPLLVVDEQLRVVSSNPAFHRLFNVASEDINGRLVYELGKGQWDIPELRKLLEEILPENATFQDYRVAHEFLDIGKKELLITGRRIEQHTHRPGLILMAIREATNAT